MMLARNSKRLLAMLMAMVMCLGLVGTSALAGGHDTEFHIMKLDTIKSYLSNENVSAEDIHIQSIYVSDGEKCATGGGVNGERGWFGEPYWYVLNTCDIIDAEAITGITVNYCVNGELTSCVIPSEMLRIDHLGGLITEIYLNYDVPEPEPEPDPEPEMQTVYVYVQAKEGQGTSNGHGYFTLGTIQLPLEEATWDDTGDGEARYAANSKAVSAALAKLQRGGYNDWIVLDDVKWYSLHAADGADNYVDSGTMTWHLDGKLKDEVQLYYVKYDLNGGTGVAPTDKKGYAAGQPFDAASGDGLSNNGYTFAGWSTDPKATEPDSTFKIPEAGGDVILYAVWTPKAETQTGTLHINKSVAGLATIPGVPTDYDVTITVTAKGKTEPTYTLNKANATPGTEGKWFEWTLNEVPAGEYTVAETAYSNNFRSGDYIYTLNGTTMTDNGAVTVTANGESWVAVTNTYGGTYDPEGTTPTEDLFFSKSVNYTSAKVGDELTYTIQVHNDGSQSAAVTIADELDDGLTYVSASNTDAVYNETTRTVSWTGAVAAGETFNLKIVAKINDDQAGQTITNVATVNGKETGTVSTAVDAAPAPGTTEPDAPTADELNALLDVVVDCTTNADHADKTYTTLLADSYEVSEVKDSACTVTIQAAPYVADYGNDHTLSGDASKTVNLVYDNGWKLVNSADATVTFTVTCSTEPTTDPSTNPGTDPVNPPYTGDDDGNDEIVVVINPGRTPTGSNPEPSEEPSEEPTEIPEPSTPMTDLPEDSGEDIPEATTPLAPSPDVDDGSDDTEIVEGTTPMGDLPQTGAVAAPVNPAVTASLVALAFSMAGCGLYFTFGRKKGEEED